MKNFLGVMSLLAMILSITGGLAANRQASQAGQAPDRTVPVQVDSSEQFPPIDNMHHFMEYISQPNYKALKSAFAGEPPANRRAWGPIKSSALILAETSALVAQRVPDGATEEQAKQWNSISQSVYQSGKQLYQSAGNFDESKQHFGTMIDHCNRCHQVFDNGKHQLEK